MISSVPNKRERRAIRKSTDAGTWNILVIGSQRRPKADAKYGGCEFVGECSHVSFHSYQGFPRSTISSAKSFHPISDDTPKFLLL